MNQDLFKLLKANSFLEKLPETLRELWNRTMVAPEEAMDTREMIAKEAVQATMEVEVPKSARIVAEIPMSLHTLRPKKDKQGMVLVRITPINLLRTKLTMEEKGKDINLEVDEEEAFT